MKLLPRPFRNDLAYQRTSFVLFITYTATGTPHSTSKQPFFILVCYKQRFYSKINFSNSHYLNNYSLDLKVVTSSNQSYHKMHDPTTLPYVLLSWKTHGTRKYGPFLLHKPFYLTEHSSAMTWIFLTLRISGF